jgi:hypothetical protein
MVVPSPLLAKYDLKRAMYRIFISDNRIIEQLWTRMLDNRYHRSSGRTTNITTIRTDIKLGIKGIHSVCDTCGIQKEKSSDVANIYCIQEFGYSAMPLGEKRFYSFVQAVHLIMI